MRLLLPLVLAAALGCTTARPVMTPSGARGWYIRCRSEDRCFAKAERVCPLGYRVIRERALTTAVASTIGDTTVVREHPGASLVIECAHLED